MHKLWDVIQQEKRPRLAETIRRLSAKAAKPPKVKLSTVALKQVIKTGKDIGKEAAAVQVNADGSFTVSFRDPGATAKAIDGNPWDEVLE
jgi:hypothetical protein